MLGNATFSLIARFDGIGREPSGDDHANEVDIPSLTGALAHFRFHYFNAIRCKPGGLITPCFCV